MTAVNSALHHRCTSRTRTDNCPVSNCLRCQDVKFCQHNPSAATNTLADIAIGLKSLELPVNLCIEIFHFVCANRRVFPFFFGRRAPFYWKIATMVRAREVWLVSRARMNEWRLARKRMQATVQANQRRNWAIALATVHRFLDGDGSGCSVAVHLTRNQIIALSNICRQLCIDVTTGFAQGDVHFIFSANDHVIL